MHLRPTEFSYRDCRPFTENKERKQKFKKTGSYIYQSELNKVYFQHDMACGNFKNLPRGTAYQRGLTSLVYKILHKIFAATSAWSETLAAHTRTEIKSNADPENKDPSDLANEWDMLNMPNINYSHPLKTIYWVLLWKICS